MLRICPTCLYRSHKKSSYQNHITKKNHCNYTTVEYTQKEEIKKLKKEIEILKRYIEKCRPTTTIKNNNYLQPFLNFIEMSTMSEILLKKESSKIFSLLLKTIYFNKKVPQNNSIKITNCKTNKVHIYTGTWGLVEFDVIVDKLILLCVNFIDQWALSDIYDNYTNKMSEADITEYKKKKESICSQFLENEYTNNKKIKESIKILLYNNRNVHS